MIPLTGSFHIYLFIQSCIYLFIYSNSIKQMFKKKKYIPVAGLSRNNQCLSVANVAAYNRNALWIYCS